MLSSWWNGVLFFYKNFDDAKDHIVTNSYVDETTVSDGKFLNNESAILAADSGRITIINLSEQSGDELIAKDSYCNTARINQLDLWKSSKKVVTCSENNITLWNTNGSLSPIQDFRNFHTDIVSSVNCKNSAADVFISGSWDNRLCIWDVRLDTPASVLNDMQMGPVTAVSFDDKLDNYVYMGTVGGYICSIDTRNTKEFIDKCHAYKNRIHRINVNQNHVAVCADAIEVRIFESNNGEVCLTYENSLHRDMVRGLAWYKEDAFSCGADRKLHKHICV